MKKIVTLSIALLIIVGCSASNNQEDVQFDEKSKISVVSREDGSGTRGAFIELLKIEEKDGAGNKKDLTSPEAVIANKTDVMMSNVANNINAIGYLSLGSLNDSVKALKIDGVEATVETIKRNEYKVARPFNIVVQDDLDEVSMDFVKYILSKEGQKVVEDQGYIAIDANESYTKSSLQGKIVVAGSSSVSPVMEKLSEAYQLLNKEVIIEIQTSDSTAGVQAAIDKTAQIGMASRELKDAENKQVKGIVIGIDGIVVVVNQGNTLSDLTSEQVKEIYTGKVSTWDQVGQ